MLLLLFFSSLLVECVCGAKSTERGATNVKLQDGKKSLETKIYEWTEDQ